MSTNPRIDRSENLGQQTDPQRAFAELSRIMLGDQPLNETLQRVAELSQQVIPEVHDASVTLIEGDRVRTVVFTGRLAVDLDERQYDAGFGPCLDAAMTGNTIVVDTSDTSTSYADFNRVAYRAGVRHVLSVGLPVPQRVVGGLNLYGRNTEPFDEDSMQLALTFATYAAVAVANAALYSSTANLAKQMQLAVKSRAVIDQAKGILMAQYRYSGDDAFAALVQLSQHRNVKLREVAQTIVDNIEQT
ncbi:MAG TPA: GAF and ANTAR domain-containing protein [Propionibacteriaceae bacterium]|jgi:GAF domain-containing protein